jgi:hypothetical protein
MMRTLLHLKPGQKGTKQLFAQYGERLICVRYRYDAQRKKRFKTVELIVAERDWKPPLPRFAAEAIVGVRVGFAEGGGTAAGEASGWEVQSQPPGVGDTLRSSSRAQLGRPYR